MKCFLDLLDEKKIDLDPLVTHSFPVEKAPDAFDIITTSAEQSIGVVLEYGNDEKDKDFSPQTVEPAKAIQKLSSSRPRIGIIGAGILLVILVWQGTTPMWVVRKLSSLMLRRASKS